MSEYSGQLTHVEPALVPIWLIVFLPLLGAAINTVAGFKLQASTIGQGFAKRTHTGSFLVSVVAIGVMVIAFALTCVNVAQLFGLEAGHRHVYTHMWQLLRIGSLDANLSFAMDTLGAVMGLVVTGVGLLIHIYATGYMAKDPSYWRFFAGFNLFIFAMLLLVFGDNFFVMFFGWEGVGLSSYLLIGFWYKDYFKATCGTKAFIVNRIGDWGFICGIALLLWGLGGKWIGQGEYQHEPDMPRFVPVLAEPLGHGSEHGAEHGGEHDHAPPHAQQGAPAVPSTDDGRRSGTELAAAGPGGRPDPHDHGHDHGAPRPQPGAHDHGAQKPGGHDHAHRKRPHPATHRPMADIEEIRRRAGAIGQLTMTTHPGAKVFLGPSSVEELQKIKWVPCDGAAGWKNSAGSPCYVESPFLRRQVPAMVHNIAIVPGDGAVVGWNDGNEVALLKEVQIGADEEIVISALGPSLTFREIQDQLLIKNASGKFEFRQALEDKKVWFGMGLLTLACLCFFLGACGKSAQIPLFTWLPDAMAGPTPVSALIHAATMVTAGVYMVARLNFVFSLTTVASGTVALVGAATALFAATIGFFQYDIKKVLAYSTVSQLGFMFIGVGVGAYWAAVFHLMTHAFFKACLFLGSGSVIHGMHHVEHDEAGAQDMRNMGGLKRRMPWTARTYFIACLAITAAPIPFLAGFWSKDEILWKAFNAQLLFLPGWVYYAIGLVAALGTSFYMWRSYYLTFEGPHAKKEIAKEVHESPGAMVNVLIVLAFFSVFLGVVLGLSKHHLGGHGEPLFEQWLHPVLAHAASNTDAHWFAHYSLGLEYTLMALSVGGAIAAWWLARKRYGAARPADWAEIEGRLPGFSLLNHKYYIDEIYDRSVVRGFLGMRKVLFGMDRWIVEGVVNAVGWLTRAAAWLSGAIDKYFVDWVVNLVAQGTLRIGGRLRTVQTGRIQNYIYGILGGIVFFAILQYFLQ